MGFEMLTFKSGSVSGENTRQRNSDEHKSVVTAG